MQVIFFASRPKIDRKGEGRQAIMRKTKEKGAVLLQVLYVDVLLIANWAMNYLSLSLTAGLLRRRVTVARRLLAALLGGVYAVAAVLF